MSSDNTSNEERRAMIADAAGHELLPHEAEELGELADLLANPSTWAEPRAGLEDEIVQSVGAAKPARVVSGRRVRRFGAAAAAVAASVAITLGIVATQGTSSADFTARLSATALAPAARGSAGVTRNNAGFRIRLDAHGLPRLGPREYYQAWLKNDRGTSVPIGTFSSSDGIVTLWSGVSPAEFPMLTVTRELTDNDQTSSGRVVLRGAVHAR